MWIFIFQSNVVRHRGPVTVPRHAVQRDHPTTRRRHPRPTSTTRLSPERLLSIRVCYLIFGGPWGKFLIWAGNRDGQEIEAQSFLIMPGRSN